MATTLAETGTKYITVGTPQYPADVANNASSYDKPPDYSSGFFLRAALVFEKFTFAESNAQQSQQNQVFVPSGVTSSFTGNEFARLNARAILEHSKVLNIRKGVEGDGRYVTTTRIGEVLENELLANDIVAQNEKRVTNAAGILSENLKNKGIEAFVYNPFQREYASQLYQKCEAVSRGGKPEDVHFEGHFWVPRILFKDTTHFALLSGVDHAWSNNAAIEKAAGLAVIYGNPILNLMRESEPLHFIDEEVRSISVLDMAWECARHLVYEVSRPLEVDGEEVQVRSERAAALFVAHLMWDDFYRQGKDAPEEAIKLISFIQTLRPITIILKKWRSLIVLKR